MRPTVPAPVRPLGEDRRAARRCLSRDMERFPGLDSLEPLGIVAGAHAAWVGRPETWAISIVSGRALDADPRSASVRGRSASSVISARRGGGGHEDGVEEGRSRWGIDPAPPSRARGGGARRSEGGTHGARRWIGGGGIGADADEELAELVDLRVRGAAAEHLVKHHAERPEVRAAVDVLVPLGLLRGHVERRADHAAGAREVRHLGVAVVLAVLDLGDAEIEELDDAEIALAREEEVRGLDVAVEDLLLVGHLERAARLRGDAERELGREGAEALEELAEVLAFEELHDHVRELGLVVDARVEDLDDVRGVERGDGARLAMEAGDQRRVLGEVGGDHLHGDAVAGVLLDGLEDGAHAALSEAPHDGVLLTDRRGISHCPSSWRRRCATMSIRSASVRGQLRRA